MMAIRRNLKVLLIAVVTAMLSGAALGGDWTQWRGPEENGVSRERGLPETWDPDTGQNVLWTSTAGGMSSPVVMKNRVYTWTRAGEVKAGNAENPTLLAGAQTREALVCLNADTGKQIWEHLENIEQTDDPFHRLGWGNVVADPQSNHIYGMDVSCNLICLDADTGKVVWSHHMTEEYGLISTFGGRTPSPAVDEDQLFIGGVSFGWGDQAQGQHRLYAFNKNTGVLNWSAGTGGRPVDAPYNTPVIININGQWQVMLAAGDGGVHSYQARTGKHVWSFPASKRGLNASVVVEGSRIFICHSEENMDNSVLGRVVCIDVSDDHPKEIWRNDGIEAGFGSPTIGNGCLYVIDNKATVWALDVSTGITQWKKNTGTIGKASLVLADNKLYVPEANGRFVILRPEAKSATVLSKVELDEKLGREYVIFGSVAVSDGRVFLQSANHMYCIADKTAKVVAADPIPAAAAEDPIPADEAPAFVQVLPAESLLAPGQKANFTVRLFDAKGRLVSKPATSVQWAIAPLMMPPPPTTQPGTPPTPVGNLLGQVDANGLFTAAAGPPQGGAIAATVTVGDKTIRGIARVRVMPDFPWHFDFKAAPVGKPPLTWIGAGGKFAVKEIDGAKALTKLTDFDLYHQARTYLGDTHMTNYTIEADIKAGEKMLGESRQIPNIGVINSKYTLVLLGNYQRCQLNVWAGALPTSESWSGSLNKTVAFKWEPNTSYHFKLRVDQSADHATVSGKVWAKGSPEPEAWTLQMQDTQPNTEGAPGLYADSLVTPAQSEVYFTDVTVTANK